MLKRLHLQQKGDTIVEVLIVLAVLGLALGISYATASRSLTATRQAQESSKATELLRSQLESIRVLAANGASAPPELNVFSTGFCIDTNNTVKPAKNGSTPNPDCRFNDLYQVEIEPPSGSNGNVFVLKAAWDDVGGSDEPNRATLIYRWYAP